MSSLKPALVLSISLCLFSYHAHAGWGDFLEDLEETGKSILSGNTDSSNASTNTSLSTDTIIAGLKEALSVGSRRAIEEISQENGFLDNDLIHIPLPEQVEQAGQLMRQFGLSQIADDFEASMNHAAEKAAPEATEIVINAIKEMSIEDAKNILNGADDAATQYFKEHTTEKLTNLFKPTIESSLNDVGSTRYYNQLNEQLESIPVVGQSLNVDLPDYVTTEALDGLFTMLAAEEKKIRENPTARTTELLKKVFQ